MGREEEGGAVKRLEEPADKAAVDEEIDIGEEEGGGLDRR